MKSYYIRFYLSMAFLFVSYLSQAQYTLVWQDEFSTTGSTSPNAAHWNMENWWAGYSGGEIQAYTPRLQNARVENGNLIIEAKREAYTTPGTIKTATWTSARLQTRKKHELLYGKIEVRAKLPAGAGTWPAIWMLASDDIYGDWPISGEIDIMEHTYSNNQQGSVHGTLHTGSYNWVDDTHITATYPVADFSTAYHVYGLEWSPTTLKISVDGNVYLTRTKSPGDDHMAWPYDKPGYLILNVAMGAGYGGPIDPNLNSATMAVDYVRMYSYTAPLDTENPTAPASLTGTSTSPAVDLSWPPSRDNFSVKHYQVYQGLTLIGTTVFQKYFVNNLQPYTNYTFKVRAEDYSGRFSPFVTSAPVTTTGPSVALVNPGFEADAPTQTPSGWSEAFTTAASYTEAGGRSGLNKLVHYAGTSFKASTYKTHTGLENGTYLLTAYYRGGGGNMQMIARGFGGTTQSVSLGTVVSSWTQKAVHNIVVTNNQITIEFLSDFSTSPTGGWLMIDDVVLSRTGNLSFEISPDFNLWTDLYGTRSIVTTGGYNSPKYASFGSTTYNQGNGATHSVTGLTAGTSYSLRGWFKNVTGSEVWLMVKNPADNVDLAARQITTLGSGWTQTSDITFVAPSNSANIVIWVGPYTSAHFDNFTVTPVTQPTTPGVGYYWRNLSSLTDPGTRMAEPKINDQDATEEGTYQIEDNSSDNTYQAAGIIWNTAPAQIFSVRFTNGVTDSFWGGWFESDMSLQWTDNGGNSWNNSSMTLTSSYPYSHPADGLYTFSGPALPVTTNGIRVIGKVYTQGNNGSWRVYVAEIEARNSSGTRINAIADNATSQLQLNQAASTENITVYPNPVSDGWLTVSLTEQTKTIRLQYHCLIYQAV